MSSKSQTKLFSSKWLSPNEQKPCFVFFLLKIKCIELTRNYFCQFHLPVIGFLNFLKLLSVPLFPPLKKMLHWQVWQSTEFEVAFTQIQFLFIIWIVDLKRGKSMELRLLETDTFFLKRHTYTSLKNDKVFKKKRKLSCLWILWSYKNFFNFFYFSKPIMKYTKNKCFFSEIMKKRSKVCKQKRSSKNAFKVLKKKENLSTYFRALFVETK